ncbi:glycosyltransferase family 4 protein [Hoeflea sp.]|uniref:glycosyltransferase family 4 protein n=1 Tax=Hoeflea sp. TaxID=1940281 RepID=UPI003B0263B3
MTKVSIFGTLREKASGYHIHGREFSRAIQENYNGEIEFIDFFRSSPDSIVERLSSADYTKDDIALLVCHPSVLSYFQSCDAYKICYAIWESTVIPDNWSDFLAVADEIWTPTQWGRQILIQNAIAPEKIIVIPEGVNGAVFKPEGNGVPFLESINDYKLLHVGKAEPRKATCELLMAFDQAFTPDDNVKLIIACHNRNIPGFCSVKFIENLTLRNRENVIPVQPLLEHRLLADLYRSCDAFIYPSRAEGWGLPALEAMACGLPLAITRYSGQTAYVTDRNALHIPYEIERLNAFDLPHFEREDGDYGEWASPDINALADIMKYMFANKRLLKEKALSESESIREKWDWRQGAVIAVRRLNEIKSQLREAIGRT